MSYNSDNEADVYEIEEGEIILLRCPLCEFQTTTAYRLKTHLLQTHPEEAANGNFKFSCERCSKTYISVTQLDIHMQTKCGSDKQHVCVECGKAFLTAANLKQHSASHSLGGFLCNYCGKSFALKGSLKVHERCHTKEKSFICNVCNKGFSFRESLVTHSTIHTGIKPYECVCCKRTFSCVGNLLKHKKRRPTTCGSEKYQEVKKCAPRTSTKGQELKNKPWHKQNLKVSVSETEDIAANEDELDENQYTEYEFVLDEPLKESEQEVEQEVEPQVDPSEMYETIMDADTEEDETKPDSLNFECFEVSAVGQESQSGDGTEQTTEYALEFIQDQSYDPLPSEIIEEAYDDETEENNINQELEDEVEEIEVAPAINVSDYCRFTDSTYECTKCPKAFSTFTRFLRHLRKDHNVSRMVDNQLKEYMIQKLNKTYTQNKPMRVHPPPYPNVEKYILACSKCARTFSSRTLLNDHERSDCGRNPMYKCEDCGKRYMTAGSLKTHRSVHSGEMNYVCQHCGKAYRTAGQLKIHSRIHSKEKPFQCQYCNKAFAHRETLITHESIHTGYKRFACHCGKKFTCITNLKCHRNSNPLTCGLLPINTKPVKPDEMPVKTELF